MKRILALIIAPVMALGAVPFTVSADPRVEAVLEEHILPGFAALSEATGALAAAQTCDVVDEWSAAVTAWVSVSHLRFGPSEADNRAFALAFWPDPRAATPKALASILAQYNPIIADESVAGRGFYAMEFLLFDPAFANADGRCALIAALAEDADATARAIEEDWQTRYADLMRDTGNDTYRTDEEALQELYKALSAGLQFNADARLSRPLGTFDRPRATRAEMRRSARSAVNVMSSMAALDQLAGLLAGDNTALAEKMHALFARVRDQSDVILETEGGADFSLVDRPADRLKVEALLTNVTAIRALIAAELGPDLGVIEGFNSLDGD